MDWLIGHLVGDYLVQTEYQATHKKLPGWPGRNACSRHCLFYALTVWLFTGWPAWTLILIYLSHYALDRTTLVGWWFDVTGRESFKNPPLFPWSWIVTDNVIHVVTLWLIEKLVSR